MAKSERSSRKSSTAKSPSSWAIPQAAGTVSKKAIEAMITEFLNVPEPSAIFFSQRSGMR